MAWYYLEKYLPLSGGVSPREMEETKMFLFHAQGIHDDLSAAWHQFHSDAQLLEVVPPPIAHSWLRCHGRDIHWPSKQATYSIAQEVHDLIPVLRPIVEDVFQYIEGAGCALCVTDVRGVIVDIVGDHDLTHALISLGIADGVCWSEEERGTNAFALALINAMPTSVVGCAHFFPDLHPFYTVAAPFFDGTGLPLGTIGMIGHLSDGHVYGLGMVAAAAQAMTNQLQTHFWVENAQERLSELSSIVQSLSEGIILLSSDQRISAMNARAGHLLGLNPARVTGRAFADVVLIPAPLAHALRLGREFTDEEVAFQVNDKRVACLSTLKAIHSSLPAMSSLTTPSGAVGISAHPNSHASGGFVLSFRAIERVQKLIHRMTGARARMTFSQITGQSAALQEALRLARIAAGSAATVLLRGETGTGKEMFAQSIHNASDRASGPFVAINCAAIPRELISSELFGYEGGAFTGADRQGRPGKFELAHEGTLFLDEIGDMPRDLQTTLLRALETHSVTRVGGQQVIPVDVRIIAATHQRLEDEIAEGAFRSDLFYRLNVFSVYIPPLRERREDIPQLIHGFIQRFGRMLGHTITVLPETLETLTAYGWPGNVRELENTIERAVYVAEGGVIHLDDLPPALRMLQAIGQRTTPPPTKAITSLRESLAQQDEAIILQALEATSGNLNEASRLLGISRTTLWRRRKTIERNASVS